MLLGNNSTSIYRDQCFQDIYQQRKKASFAQLKMDFTNGESPSELLQAQVHVWNHTFNFINSMSLKCAIQLGIPDIIHNHGQPMTLSNLVAALPVHPTKTHYIYRLMRMLVHTGFFAHKNSHNRDQEEYSLTLASRLLLKDEPLRASPLSLIVLDPILTTPWHFLSTWFENNDPTPFEIVHGKTFYGYLAHEPSLGNMFNEAMATDSQLVGRALIGEGKGVFEGLKSLVDVAGGTGTVAKAIADAFPHLKCTVFDLPHVVADLQGTQNLDFLGGDMFEAIPPANAILLKWILHNWNDEQSIKILKRCREAIPSREEGGKVIIIDMAINQNQKVDEKLIKTQLFFDMLMMVLLDGIERTEKEWEKLFLAAGFSHYKITPILGLRSLIEVFP
ncbi:hypothetical protein L1049_024774 [Liquidambar formosana]|uniref:Uncharacterized protein n=1 Tax=Liquidambar formosana TaxID=63359 RepID=A0AAP0WYR4_LIQFO